MDPDAPNAMIARLKYGHLLETPFSEPLLRTVIRPPGVDLEGSPKVLQEPYLSNTLGFA